MNSSISESLHETSEFSVHGHGHHLFEKVLSGHVKLHFRANKVLQLDCLQSWKRFASKHMQSMQGMFLRTHCLSAH